jgi:branched-chain amino acid transport system substrate-binding protein
VAATAVLLAAVALAAAGCGSSSSSSKKATSSGGTAAKGATINLGSICSCSGPEAPSLGGAEQTLQAWASYTNANGGINHHPVKLTVLDDGGSATTSAQDARQLVEQDHVMAIVGELSLNDGTWQNYVAQQGVPVIGAANYNPVFATNPDFFSTGSQTPALTYGVLAQAKADGATKMAVLPCAEAPACTQFLGLFKALGPLLGVNIVYSPKITVTQPSYTANCLAAKSAGAKAMVILENSATVVRFANQCSQQGYTPTQLNLTGTVGTNWTSSSALSGAIGIESNPVLAVTSGAMATYHAAIAQYASSLPSNSVYNELDVQAWDGAQAFALAAKRANVTPTSTPADVKKGLYTFKNETVGGLTPPLTFTAGKPAFTTCYFVTKVAGGKFTAPFGATGQCIAPATLPALAKALGG